VRNWLRIFARILGVILIILCVLALAYIFITTKLDQIDIVVSIIFASTLISVIIAWRWEIAGGILLILIPFAIAGYSYFESGVNAFTSMPVLNLLEDTALIFGPLFLAGILFLLSGIKTKRHTASF
jgi:hypothetical protein